MRLWTELRSLLRRSGYRRLLAVRLTGQVGDGLVQVAAAAYVVFSPEHQPDAGAIATLFAVTLLPYSIVGPLAGIGLDRWSRRQILAVGNLVRAVTAAGLVVLAATDAPTAAFFAGMLVTLAVNRFLLSGLSAGLPHVVGADELVTANAITPTLGSLALVVGTALAGLVTAVLSSPVALALGVVCYLGAGACALRLGRRQLGPDRLGVRQPGAAATVLRGLVDAVAYATSHRRLLAGLGSIVASRFAVGFVAVLTILWFRNGEYAGRLGTAFAAIAAVGLALGVGVLLAAVVTPYGIGRLGLRRWLAVCFAVLAIVTVFPTVLFSRPALVVTGLVTGLASQSIKIGVDTVLQTYARDQWRGRIYALQDMTYNGCQVLAALAASLVLPIDGRGPIPLAVIGVGLLACAAGGVRSRHRSAASPAA